jgi:hypothetical protein
MGAISPPAAERWIEVDVGGGSSLDYVEVLHNNQIIHRENIFPQQAASGVYKLHIEVGWGERSGATPWDVDLRVTGGKVIAVEPRFRGYGPTDNPSNGDFAYSDWQQNGDNHVRFHTRTRQNPSLHTPGTEGLALEVEGDGGTQLLAVIDEQEIALPLGELMTGSRTFYLGGFVSPAICFHRGRAADRVHAPVCVHAPRRVKHRTRLVHRARAAAQRSMGVEFTDLGGRLKGREKARN